MRTKQTSHHNEPIEFSIEIIYMIRVSVENIYRNKKSRQLVPRWTTTRWDRNRIHGTTENQIALGWQWEWEISDNKPWKMVCSINLHAERSPAHLKHTGVCSAGIKANMSVIMPKSININASRPNTQPHFVISHCQQKPNTLSLAVLKQ